MAEKLRRSIEKLYSAFSKYPLKEKIEGCPCCVGEVEQEKLHIKSLHELSPEDLSRYAFKAITTWGDEEDFKHFLPRIFELMSTNKFIVDNAIIFSKVELAGWASWPAEEQEAIKEFLIAWWSDMLRNKDEIDASDLVDLKNFVEIEILLKEWELSYDDLSFSNLVNFIYDHANDLMMRERCFSVLDSATIKKILEWMKRKQEVIEKGFFYYEKKDQEFAKKISDTLYIVERINSPET